MPNLVKVDELVASRRRAYFDIRSTDGITPIDSEDGGQPQISIDGATWTDVGIGVLNLIGNGKYYADLDENTVSNLGSFIQTRYKSSSTVETPGDVFQVVAFDPTKLLNVVGDGSIEWLIQVRDMSNNPLEFVDVWVTSDIDGNNMVAGVLKTDHSGEVTVQLNPGTYYLWRRHPKYNFTNPKTMVVS